MLSICLLIVEDYDPFVKLKLIDNIKKLGLTSLFELQIKQALDRMVSARCNNASIDGNLHATALWFRLLREHGYEVSQGVTELFEATHLALEGETILDAAKAFSSKLDINLAKTVAQSLEVSFHWRMQWFDVKWRIDSYEKEERIMSPISLELDKLNFNIVQAIHEKDLKGMSR
ncbi:Alpha-farnesene synthase [Vitis vinifera]|uniref:Alpha-farnesene synthase n=1 Tax=Vitis vinifera TaxID=29760 RepID=A0A438BTQ9_VITVI|nr:Alpha-farnesene synthase [Vitis vinifera]|eukprot:XP_010646947.1 PREDICTED: alpha-farnesene synthase-like [Vitis vinifera]